jgi:uncharacterized membrane protein
MEENKHMKHKRMEIVVVFIVTFLMAFLYLSGMPFCLLEMPIKNKDILFNNAFYVVNTFFLSILTIICIYFKRSIVKCFEKYVA